MPLPRNEGARRRRHREAVLGAPPEPGQPTGPAFRRHDPQPPGLRAISGTVVDASPHLLVLNTRTAGGEQEMRLPMTPSTSIWHGGRTGLHALRAGREVIVRPAADEPGVDRVWVDITRVTGTILSYTRQTVEVDAGPHRGQAKVIIPPRALGQVQVRHPRLEPGYLIDVICISSPYGPLAVRPGTSQPGHRAQHLVQPPASGSTPAVVQGTATWYGGLGEGHAGGGDPVNLGGAYPAVDPEGAGGGCEEATAGCAALPYLSYGSDLYVRNKCTGTGEVVTIIECGCVAARYCDRCVECGTSPRGRIIELTPAAFVALGGDLDAGCFNVEVSGYLSAGRF